MLGKFDLDTVIVEGTRSLHSQIFEQSSFGRYLRSPEAAVRQSREFIDVWMRELAGTAEEPFLEKIRDSLRLVIDPTDWQLIADTPCLVTPDERRSASSLAWSTASLVQMSLTSIFTLHSCAFFLAGILEGHRRDNDEMVLDFREGMYLLAARIAFDLPLAPVESGLMRNYCIDARLEGLMDRIAAIQLRFILLHEFSHIIRRAQCSGEARQLWLDLGWFVAGCEEEHWADIWAFSRLLAGGLVPHSLAYAVGGLLSLEILADDCAHKRGVLRPEGRPSSANRLTSLRLSFPAAFSHELLEILPQVQLDHAPPSPEQLASKLDKEVARYLSDPNQSCAPEQWLGGVTESEIKGWACLSPFRDYIAYEMLPLYFSVLKSIPEYAELEFYQIDLVLERAEAIGILARVDGPPKAWRVTPLSDRLRQILCESQEYRRLVAAADKGFAFHYDMVARSVGMLEIAPGEFHLEGQDFSAASFIEHEETNLLFALSTAIKHALPCSVLHRLLEDAGVTWKVSEDIYIHSKRLIGEADHPEEIVGKIMMMQAAAQHLSLAGKLRRARKLFIRSSRVTKRVRDKFCDLGMELRALGLHNAAVVSDELGESSKAVRYLAQELEIHRRRGTCEPIAALYRELARIWKAAGQRNRALALQRRAWRTLLGTENVDARVDVESELALEALDSSNYREAQLWIERALRDVASVRSARVRGAVHWVEMRIHEARKDLRECEAALGRILALVHEHQDLAREGRVRLKFGEILEARGHPPWAASQYKMALEIFVAQDQRDEVVLTLERMGGLFRREPSLNLEHVVSLVLGTEVPESRQLLRQAVS